MKGTIVLTAETSIATGNAGAYLARLCEHLSKLSSASRLPGHGPRLHAGGGQPPAVLHIEHTQTAGTITLAGGRLTLAATHSQLAVRAEASSQQNLQRIQEMITARLLKFSRRREHLDIRWSPGPDSASRRQAAG
jgi:hypothetical protein